MSNLLPLQPLDASNESTQEVTNSQNRHSSLEQGLNQWIAFHSALNRGQHSTRRSFNGVLIKEQSLIHWFEQNRPSSIKRLKLDLPIKANLIDRIIAKQIATQSATRQGDALYPGPKVIQFTQTLFSELKLSHTLTHSPFQLHTDLPLFTLLARFSAILMPYREKLSAQYFRIEFPLWRQAIFGQRHKTTTGELEFLTQTPKSTLTTLLSTAQSLGLIDSKRDVEDARILRWQLNSEHESYMARKLVMMQIVDALS